MEICKTCLDDVDLPAVGNAKRGECDVCHSSGVMVMTTPEDKYNKALKVSEGEGLDPSLVAQVTTSDDNNGTVYAPYIPINKLSTDDPSAVIAYKSLDGKLFLTLEEKNEYESKIVDKLLGKGIKQVGDDLYISYSVLDDLKSFITIHELVEKLGCMPMRKDVQRDLLD